MNNPTNLSLGKQIFILYPDQEPQHNILTHLVRSEFEVYGIRDHTPLPAYIAETGRAVLCINVHNRLTPQEWTQFIHAIRRKTDCTQCSYAVLVKPDYKSILQEVLPESPEKTLLLDPSQEEDILKKDLVQWLEEQQARGQRSYVRFGGTEQPCASFTFSVQDTLYSASVKDISSAGMACWLDEEAYLDIDQYIKKIILSLGDKQFELAGRIFQQRWLDRDQRLFIVMFDKRMPANVRRTLQDFIHSSLQEAMEKKLKRFAT
jgi:hypothetical protein